MTPTAPPLNLVVLAATGTASRPAALSSEGRQSLAHAVGSGGGSGTAGMPGYPGGLPAAVLVADSAADYGSESATASARTRIPGGHHDVGRCITGRLSS